MYDIENLSPHIFRYYIEQKTAPAGSAIPDKPSFNIEKQPNENNNGYDKVKVTWNPNYHGNPGSHFYVQYRKEGESQFQNEKEQISEDSYVIAGLEPNENYEFRVVSVDGEHQMPSNSQIISTSDGSESIQNPMSFSNVQ